jgi:hypothetical protein
MEIPLWSSRSCGELRDAESARRTRSESRPPREVAARTARRDRPHTFKETTGSSQHAVNGVKIDRLEDFVEGGIIGAHVARHWIVPDRPHTIVLLKRAR